MDLEGFFILVLFGVCLIVGALLYCACGVLLAAALGFTPWSVTWYACVLVWPAAITAIAWLALLVMQIFAVLVAAVSGR